MGFFCSPDGLLQTINLDLWGSNSATEALAVAAVGLHLHIHCMSVTRICYKGSLQVAGLLLTRELLDKLGLLVTCRELASAWGKYTVLAAA
jgi:hypothetical protein